MVLELIEDALQDLGEAGPKGLLSDIAVVAHGGYGRRDVAPYSDVDLMILHRPAAAARLFPLAERLVRDVFDVGLVLGHSVRTVRQACAWPGANAMICTSLVDSRLLAGNPLIFESFMHTFRQRVRWRCGRLLAGIKKARDAERLRYGETVFLLEPNIKRSQGTLRDLHLLRWIGFARYGAADFAELHDRGVLSREEYDSLQAAYAFLLTLRNDLHFHSGQASDVLTRSEQLRLAEQGGSGTMYPWSAADGLLPVEHFMRDYFRHTNRVSHVATKFMVKATTHPWLDKTLTVLFGHHIELDYVVGPGGDHRHPPRPEKLHGNLAEIMQLVDLANLHDVPIAAFTWEDIRREAPHLPPHLPPEASRHFLSLLAHPGHLGTLLRDLHEAAILERFLPEFARARGLLQFNQYHKYTVDEHCIRAVEFTEKLLDDPGPLGRVYRGLRDKRLLHLALLIHDLGKGLLEDHREVGLKIAEQTGRRLGLQPHETEIIKFLVHKHLRMNHLALRRDTSDEELVVRFAVQVGSPELLQMLYVLTAADFGAVGPDVWDGWKSQVLTDLYHRAMQQLAGDSPATTTDHAFESKRGEIRASLSGHSAGTTYAWSAWFSRHIDDLTAGYLMRHARRASGRRPAAAARPGARRRAGGRPLRARSGHPAGHRRNLRGRCSRHLPQADRRPDQPGSGDPLGPDSYPGRRAGLGSLLGSRSGLFRRAALRSHPEDHSGGRAVVAAGSRAGPILPPHVEVGRACKLLAPKPQIRVNTDNSTSDRYTIIDVFAYDRTGLLYAVTRTFFELGCSVWRAKISTYFDQVLNVFYVTDQEDRKITDQGRLDTIRQRLLEVIGEDEEK